jgi:hypothetical protein
VNDEGRPDLSSVVDQFAAEEREKTAANIRALLTIDLATISLLVDAKIVTVEEAAQRIELVQSSLQADPAHPKQSPLVQVATNWLRSRGLPGQPSWVPTVHQGGRSDDSGTDR